MSKWLAVMALGAAMAAAGCENNKDDGSDPMKMSSGTSSCCNSKKAAEPKKLSTDAAKADCQTKCPAGADKAK